MIVDAARLFSFSDFGSCDAHGVNGVGVFDPVDDVNVMESHVDVDIAALPREIELVVELVLELIPFWAPGKHGACSAHVPEGACVVDFADGAVVDAFDGFEVAEFVAALESDTDFEIFFLGVLGSGEHASNADGVECHGFFHEDVFSLFDRFFEHHGSKGARRGEDDDIAGGDGLFVALEAEEYAFFGDVHAGAVLDGEVLEGFLNLFVKEFRDSDEFNVGAGFERLVGSSRGASSAAHHGEFERPIFFCGMGEPFDGECGQCGPYGGGFEEVSSGELVGVVHGVQDLK